MKELSHKVLTMVVCLSFVSVAFAQRYQSDYQIKGDRVLYNGRPIVADARSFQILGYGYAKVSKEITKDWGRMMEEFFSKRENLKRVVQLVDIRHAPSKQDIEMYEYLKHYGLSGLVCATKGDKVSGNERQKNKALIRKTLGLDENDKLIVVSALKKSGAQELLEAISLELED